MSLSRPSRKGRLTTTLAILTGLSRPQIAQMQRQTSGRKRLRAWLADSSCWWCGDETTLALNAVGQPTGKTATIDHIVTRHAGRAVGESVPKVTACSSCNAMRNEIELAIRNGAPIPRVWRNRFTRNLPPELVEGPGSLYDLVSLEEHIASIGA